MSEEKRDRMLEFEETIKKLEEIQGHFRALAGIAQTKQGRAGHLESAGIIADALALLKAQEPSDDWISRKRLKNEIQYYIEEAGWGDEVNKVLGWCLEFIDSQEAVKWE